MNINQQKLENNDIELIKKVLDHTLYIGSTKICFKDIADKLILDLSVPENDEYETISMEQLIERSKELEIECKKAEQDYRSFSDKFHKIVEALPDEERVFHYGEGNFSRSSKEVQDMYNELNRLGRVWESISSTSRAIKEAINAGGIIRISVLGSFCSNNQTVYLYLNTIERKARTIKNVVAKEITKPLITTFIHEMFHAWNYFASNSQERTVEEIDEAMVECYTLLFLQDISKSMPEFEPIFEWAKNKIQSKQSSIGKHSAYGFGYYLFSLWGTNDTDRLKRMLEAYSRKSGRLNNQSGLVKNIQSKFSPTYPRSEEDAVFELFYKVIVSARIQGQVWSPSGKTNIVTHDHNLLFENNVDEIEAIKYGRRMNGHDHYDVLYRVKENNVYRIYWLHRGKLFLLFEEAFDQVTSMDYGIETVIFLKPYNEQRTFMLTLRDIRRILDDIIYNSSDTKNTLSSSCCIFADDFYVYEDGGKPILIAKKGEKYDYIFPMLRHRPKVIPNIVPPIGVSYFQFRNSDYVHVFVNKKDSKYGEIQSIYTMDGEPIGNFDFFAPPIDTPYSVCQKDGKWNCYSFETMGMLFDKWFDEIYTGFEKNGEVFFPVAENDICKIIDINGHDVSKNFPEALSEWKQYYEELK